MSKQYDNYWDKMINEDKKKSKKYCLRTIAGYIVACCGIVYAMVNARYEGAYDMHGRISETMSEYLNEVKIENDDN